MRLLPDHCDKMSSHHWRLSFALAVKGMWWWSFNLVVLKLMSLRRNIQPPGNTLQVNDSFSIKESGTHFVQLQRYLRWTSSESKACFCSCVMLASIVVMFNRIPKNVSGVGRISTLEDFTVHWFYCRGKELQLGCSCSHQCWHAWQWRSSPGSV